MSQLISFWPYILIVILVIAIIVLFQLHITFHIVYTQINNHTHLRIGATALNKIVNIGLKTLFNTKNKTSGDKLVDETNTVHPFFSLPNISETFTLFHRFKAKHLKHMVCDELKWETQIGINDPMGSALLCGSLWGIKYYFLGLLSGKIKYVRSPIVHIQPLYNHIHFNTELNCKIKIRFRQAVWISIKLVWHLSKARKKKRKLRMMTN